MLHVDCEKVKRESSSEEEVQLEMMESERVTDASSRERI